MKSEKTKVTKRGSSKMGYADGFLIAIPTKNISAYRRIAKAAGKVWRELGALEYCECMGEDLKIKMGVSFNDVVKIKRGETVIFSWITYKSRAQRDIINANVMKDPRLAKLMDPKKMPFDIKRMSYGGFKVLVDL